MTITLDKHLEQFVRRQASEAGYSDVLEYVRDRLSDPQDTSCQSTTDEQTAVERRAEIEAWLDQLTGSATRKITWEEIAAETRGD